MAEAKKGTVKKAAKKAAAAAPAPAPAVAAKKDKEAVENFKKSDFVASIAEKTGMTKVDSEAALNAVLDTLSDVSTRTCYNGLSILDPVSFGGHGLCAFVYHNKTFWVVSFQVVCLACIRTYLCSIVVLFLCFPLFGMIFLLLIRFIVVVVVVVFVVVTHTTASGSGQTSEFGRIWYLSASSKSGTQGTKSSNR
jgi:hypothetical protein